MFLFGLHFGEGSLHNLGRPGIDIGKPAAVCPKSDGSGSMPKPATDGQDVHSGGDELGDLGMLDGVQAPWLKPLARRGALAALIANLRASTASARALRGPSLLNLFGDARSVSDERCATK
jgi:hypothetical protein